MAGPDYDLRAAMSAAARSMHATDSWEDGLQTIAEAAAASIPHFGHAGISLLTPGAEK
jgi:hypothetical protein